MNGQDSISKMALHLSTYYRTSLNNGKDCSTLRDELRNVNAYVEIMQMLREHAFQFQCETDEELDDIIVPNLLIQPLIENAILHGLDQDKTHKPGIITVQIYKDNSDLLIRVLDNGCGMEKEKCDSILNEESNHYGINNIHKRIQLLYGKEYGLTLQSTPNFGTSVTIRLKADTN
ncbi:MAG: histidine kinase [Lachnospiraceae bacterium]|nr:histidine kinase [Lachnospiraceae bacterium]